MTSPSFNPLVIVQQWHAALNEGNTEKLSALVSTDVRIEGPRGATAGVPVMLEWVERTSVHLHPWRYFLRNEVVVVEALGEWHAPQTGEITGSQTVAAVFVVEDGRMAGIARYEGLPEAFAATGLSASDEVQT